MSLGAVQEEAYSSGAERARRDPWLGSLHVALQPVAQHPSGNSDSMRSGGLKIGSQNRTLPLPESGKRTRASQHNRKPGVDLRVWVELRGFEPLTPSMRTRCATGLRYSPENLSQPSKLCGLLVPRARSMAGTRFWTCRASRRRHGVRCPATRAGSHLPPGR